MCGHPCSLSDTYRTLSNYRIIGLSDYRVVSKAIGLSGYRAIEYYLKLSHSRYIGVSDTIGYYIGLPNASTQERQERRTATPLQRNALQPFKWLFNRSDDCGTASFLLLTTLFSFQRVCRVIWRRQRCVVLRAIRIVPGSLHGACTPAERTYELSL